MDGSAKQAGARVIELVDQQARDMAAVALTKGAVTTGDLLRLETRVVDRIRRVEAIAIVQVLITAIAIGVAFAFRFG